MTNEKLNTALHEKMTAEQSKFRDWLLTQPPEEILHHAFEYTVRQDIVMAVGNLDLEGSQTAALLASRSPLGDLFQDFEKLESDHMDTIRSCIESRAKEMQRAQKELPVYRYPAAYARENNELEQYRVSHKANVACKTAIEAAIAEHYYDNILHKEAMEQVVDAFGYDRVLYVLAATVREKDGDGRISHDNKDWAKTVPVFEDSDTWGGNRNCEFVVDKCNPGLTDIFTRQARRAFLLTQPLTKEDIQAEAARILGRFQSEREPNSPSGTHFMVKISEDFLLRASSKGQDKLFNMLPFASLTFSGLKERDGIYALISKDENRDKPLRRGRASVREKLQQKPSPGERPASPKKRHPEREGH